MHSKFTYIEYILDDRSMRCVALSDWIDDCFQITRSMLRRTCRITWQHSCDIHFKNVCANAFCHKEQPVVQSWLKTSMANYWDVAVSIRWSESRPLSSHRAQRRLRSSGKYSLVYDYWRPLIHQKTWNATDFWDLGIFRILGCASSEQYEIRQFHVPRLNVCAVDYVHVVW